MFTDSISKNYMEWDTTGLLGDSSIPILDKVILSNLLDGCTNSVNKYINKLGFNSVAELQSLMGMNNIHNNVCYMSYLVVSRLFLSGLSLERKILSIDNNIVIKVLLEIFSNTQFYIDYKKQDLEMEDRIICIAIKKYIDFMGDTNAFH